MSFFTFAELLKGAERSTRKPDVLRRRDELTRVIPVRYAVDRSLCTHYAVQFTQLRAAFLGCLPLPARPEPLRHRWCVPGL